MQDVNLKQLERKAWTSYFEDGFWDILIGLMMLIMGIRGLTDIVWFGLLMLPAVLVGPLGKRFITIPRLGRVKFGLTRLAQNRRILTMLSIFVGLTVGLLLLRYAGVALPNVPVSPIMALSLVSIFVLLAYYLDFARLAIYGLFFAVSEILWGFFDKPIGPIAFTLSGVIALLVGAFMLGRFLHTYPLPAKED